MTNTVKKCCGERGESNTNLDFDQKCKNNSYHLADQVVKLLPSRVSILNLCGSPEDDQINIRSL